MTFRRHRQGDGFTLIELLVVIAILSLLMAILMPSLRKAKEQALLARCAANLKSIGSGMAVYSAENDNRAMSVNDNERPDGNIYTWQGLLGEIYLSGTPDGKHFQDDARCNVGVENEQSYVLNNYVETAPRWCGWDVVPCPSSMVAAADGGWFWKYTSYRHANYFSPNRWDDYYKYRHMSPSADQYERFGRMNSLFADWHVETIVQEDEVVTTPHETGTAMNPWYPDDYWFGHPGSGGSQTP